MGDNRTTAATKIYLQAGKKKTIFRRSSKRIQSSCFWQVVANEHITSNEKIWYAYLTMLNKYNGMSEWQGRISIANILSQQIPYQYDIVHISQTYPVANMLSMTFNYMPCASCDTWYQNGQVKALHMLNKMLENMTAHLNDANNIWVQASDQTHHKKGNIIFH